MIWRGLPSVRLPDTLLDQNQRLGHHEIQSRLGAGGMGEVYLARDILLDRLVAIKVLPAEFGSDDQRLKRFLQEAKVTSSLNHPNIGHLYEIGHEGGVYFLALEYVDGPTVGARLASGSIPVPELLDLAIQAADALVEAHAKGVLHRDLKPDNLMIDRRGQLKVLDFGLARVDAKPRADSAATRTQALTNLGVVVGTPQYMSPEQALGRTLDPRSDLFSLGVVLYQMATAAVPFHGNTVAEITDAILHQAAVPPMRINPRVPPELERIILRLIEKDPALRYQTSLDLGSDLKRLKRDTDSGHQAVAIREARGNKVWIAAAVAAVAAVSAAAFFALRPHGDTELAPQAEVTIRPILSSQTAEQQPSLSPDGKTVAYSWDGEDGKNFDIYVKSIDSGNPLRLTNSPEPDAWPMWSPDGKYVAFERLKGGAIQLLMVPAIGGVERLVAEQPQRAPETFERPAYAWHPDGKHIVYSVFGGVDKAGLVLLDLESGTRKRLTTAPRDAFDEMSPVYFPDGSKIAFLRKRDSASGTVEVLTLKDNSLRSYPMEGFARAITVVPDARSVIATSTGGMLQLRLDTGVVSAISQVPRNCYWPSFSADGRRMAVQLITRDTNIWHATLVKPGRTGPAAQWIASTYTDLDPRYSSTGEQLLFTSNRSGKTAPWIGDSQGRNPQMVEIRGPYYGSPRWSPDGRRIAYDAPIKGDAQVYAVSSMGGSPQQITSDKFDNIVPSWSHDSEWIYYCSNRSGRQEIWRVPASGGNSEQVTRNGGFDSQESSDGKYLYFSRSRKTPAVFRRTPDGQEELLVPEVGGRVWVAGTDGVYFVNKAADQLMYFDLASKRTTKVLALSKPVPITSRGIELSPNGRELLWVQIDSSSSDIALVENFWRPAVPLDGRPVILKP